MERRDGTDASGERARLDDARRLMARALALLDRARPLIAAATLDLALHQLDRAMMGPEKPVPPPPASK